MALLIERPMHGYELHAEFGRRTDATWPLNLGQVYSTLARLREAGLVEVVEEPTACDGNRRQYALTPRGRREAFAWLEEPVDTVHPRRDELAIKVAFASTTAGVDAVAVAGRERDAVVNAQVGQVRQEQMGSASAADLADSLVLAWVILHAEAEVGWLEHCLAELGEGSTAT